MSPTPLAAALLGAVALAAFVLPPVIAVLVAGGVLAAVAADARIARRRPRIARELPAVLSRGVPVGLRVRVQAPPAVTVRVRQAVPQALALEPREGDGGLEAELLPRRRGRHVVPAVGTRSVGPLRLGAWYARAGVPGEVSVFPDLLTARRLALTVRQGRYRDQGISARGPLGLGTDFELVRDYLPDDDIRQVNWRATARLGRPMSNQYRVEQDRDVMLRSRRRAALRGAAAGRRLGRAADRPRRLPGRADRGRARRRRGRRPLRRDRLRPRGPAHAAAGPPGRGRGGARAVRLPAADGRLGLRARVPARRGRQAGVRARALRPARGGGRAPAGGGDPRAHAPPRGRRGEPSGPRRGRARLPRARRGGRPGAGGRRRRRAGRPHPRRGARARRRSGRSSRRPPTGSRGRA